MGDIILKNRLNVETTYSNIETMAVPTPNGGTAILRRDGIIPSGSLNIISNGTYDVTDKASAVVNVPTISPQSIYAEGSSPASVPSNYSIYNFLTEWDPSSLQISKQVSLIVDIAALRLSIEQVELVYGGCDKDNGTIFFGGYSSILDISAAAVMTFDDANKTLTLTEATMHGTDISSNISAFRWRLNIFDV